MTMHGETSTIKFHLFLQMEEGIRKCIIGFVICMCKYCRCPISQTSITEKSAVVMSWHDQLSIAIVAGSVVLLLKRWQPDWFVCSRGYRMLEGILGVHCTCATV